MLLSFAKSNPRYAKERGQALILLAGFVALTVYLCICICIHHQLQLAGRVATSPGKVVELHPEIHGNSVYEYSVSGHTYRGTEAGTAGQGFRSNLTVFYDPLDPSQSSTMDPRRSADVMLLFVPFTAGISIVLGLLVYFGGETVRNWFRSSG